MPAERGEDGHAFGVGFGHLHRAFSPVPPDLQDADVGLGGLAFQFVSGLQLFERGLGLLEREGVLLGIDPGDHVVLDHLELRPRDRALGDLDLTFVLRRGGALLGLALADLLLQVLQLGPPVERVGELLLPVELDDEIPGLDGATRLDQAGDDEGCRVRTREPGGGNGGGLDRLHGAAQPDGPNEVAARHGHAVLTSTRLSRSCLGIDGRRPAARQAENAKNDGRRETGGAGRPAAVCEQHGGAPFPRYQTAGKRPWLADFA